VHSVRVLLDRVPELLVEQRSYLGPRVAGGVPLDIDSRDEATGERLECTRGPVPPISLPYDHELHRGVPKDLKSPRAIAEIKKLMIEGARER